MENSIKVIDLKKNYGNKEAVKNINFEIKENEIIGLLGPNGCGKTTTIGMILGLLKPTSGQVLINGFQLEKNRIVGIANGKAEFGPRALGNRSLLADPRWDIKDTVNDIKRRQRFRPFAPAILDEFADEYFEGPMNEYMQFVAKAKHDYKSVTHVDGTARVQVVKKDCGSLLRQILEDWYDRTGCPMLLNTSLNIKGEPIVNTWEQAEEWSRKYSVAVF